MRRIMKKIKIVLAVILFVNFLPLLVGLTAHLTSRSFFIGWAFTIACEIAVVLFLFLIDYIDEQIFS